jgi:hypothetical protein
LLLPLFYSSKERSASPAIPFYHASFALFQGEQRIRRILAAKP